MQEIRWNYWFGASGMMTNFALSCKIWEINFALSCKFEEKNFALSYKFVSLQRKIIMQITMDEYVFKRKIYDRMLQWKNQENGRSALLIEGARRIGKSTIVETFAKQEYKSYSLSDFSNVF